MTQITSAHFSLSTPVGSNVRRDWLRSQFGTMAVYSTWNPLYTRRTPSWTPRRSYYGPRYIRSRTSRRKANAEARAARQQRDAATVTINRVATVQVVVPVGDANGAVTINHWNQLRLSSFFPNYAPMYDQMKLDKIRVKITGFRAGTAQTSNISPSVVLAFDRNGLNEGQTVSTATISTYSSAQLKQWSTGNAFVMYQNIYPSTIMEKGQYIPTESLEDPTDTDVVDNPCVNESSSTLPFKPLTMIGVDLGVPQAAAQTFAFTAEYEYTVTFRGMRKPSLAYLLSNYEVPVNFNGIPNWYYTTDQAAPNRWIFTGDSAYVYTAPSDGYMIILYQDGYMFWDLIASGARRQASAGTSFIFIPGTGPVAVQNEDVVLFYIYDNSTEGRTQDNRIVWNGVLKLQLTPAPVEE